MTTRFFVAVAVLLALVVFCSSFEAEAARFGGGRSFGGSPSFSRPMPSSRLPDSGMRAPSSAQQPGAVAGSPARPGFGMGGLLGGLLAGTLLGSLLSGNGFAGGGLFDILLIGGGLYLLFKFLGRRRTDQPDRAGQPGRTPNGLNMPVPEDRGQDRHAFNPGTGGGMWDALGGAAASSRAGKTGEEGARPGVSPDAPAGFDREEFLRGAKLLYQRMNDSWDKRDLEDIADFSTRPFMDEIRRQAEESPEPEKTDIMLVNADLLGVITEAGRETASVYFNVMLRENSGQGAQGAPVEVREVWHFVRAANSDETWKLDGIQQIEN
jgi:predicted lipid-binding transport protein (Tim44 family)